MYLQHFWSSGKFFVFLGTKLRQACQNLIVHVRRTFWGETTLMGKRPNFSSFPEFEQTVFRNLTRIFGQAGHKCLLRAQMKFFFISWRREMKEKLLLFENFALLSFSDFERKRCLVLLQAWLRQSCQNLFVHVQTNILRKKRFFGKFDFFPSFPEFEHKVFGVLTKNFWQGWHNCILHVHRNIFRKVIFLSKSSKFFFVVFGIWTADVWTLREKYLLPLSGLHFPLLKNHFWWKK